MERAHVRPVANRKVSGSVPVDRLRGSVYSIVKELHKDPSGSARGTECTAYSSTEYRPLTWSIGAKQTQADRHSPPRDCTEIPIAVCTCPNISKVI
eukprot:1187977-Prorocentrum_minimum.AAC.4